MIFSKCCRRLLVLCLALSYAFTNFAQTYNNGVWYSLYSEKQVSNVVVNTKISDYSVFAPTNGTLSFEYKKLSALSVNGNVEVSESADGGANMVLKGSQPYSDYKNYNTSTDISLSANINYLYFKNTSTGIYIKNIKVPLARHILLAGDNEYGAASASYDFGTHPWGEVATAVNTVALRSFLSAGNITVTSSNPQIFRLNSASNTSTVTYSVGANACASANGAAGASANAGTLGDISKYAVNIYFCPQDIASYTGTVTISDGVSTVTVALSGKGGQKTQSIIWNDDLSSVKTTDNITLSASANTSVSYTSSDNSVAYVDTDNKLVIVRDGEVTITANAAASAKYFAADPVVKTLKITKVTPSIVTAPSASVITWPAAVGTSVLTGSVDADGAWAWDVDLDSVFTPGTYDVPVLFTPDNTAWYNTVHTTVKFTVLPAVTYGAFSDTVCSGDSCLYEGVYYTGGTYEVKLTNMYGGDSIVTLSVHEYPSYLSLHVFDTICSGDTLIWNGNKYTVAADYHYYGKTVHGCDSNVTLHLTVHTAYPKVEVYDTVCAGETYTWNGIDCTKDSDYVYNTVSVHGCDSVVVLHLHVLPTSLTEEVMEMIVGMDSVWRGRDLSLYTVGNHFLSDTLTAANGCDSVITLRLNVKAPPATEGSYSAKVCPGDSLWYEGAYYTQGTYMVTLVNHLGGDSLVTLMVGLYDTYEEWLDTAIIAGSHCFWLGHDLSILPVGVYAFSDTLNTVNGCDSVINMAVGVEKAPTTYGTDGATVCYGGTYTYRDSLLTEARSYRFVLVNAAGGDSVLTFTLKYTPVYNITIQKTVYEGDSVEWDGVNVGEAGPYYDTLTSVLGCDSIITLVLTVLPRPVTYGTYDIAFCHGDSAEFGGKWYKTATVDEVLLDVPNQFGGDSLVTVTVAVWDNYSLHETRSMEYAQDVVWHEEDLSVYNPGDYVLVDSLTSVNGCDSVVTLDLHVAKRAQTIEWELTSGSLSVGDTLFLDAQATSGLPVSYTLVNEMPASLSGDTLIGLKIGSINVIARQEGNDLYEPARSITKNIIIVAPTAIDDLFDERPVKGVRKVVSDGNVYIVTDKQCLMLNGVVVR